MDRQTLTDEENLDITKLLNWGLLKAFVAKAGLRQGEEANVVRTSLSLSCPPVSLRDGSKRQQ